MASKRKFNLANLSDEEEGSSKKMDGVSLFKKYKQKTPTKVQTVEPSTIQVSLQENAQEKLPTVPVLSSENVRLNNVEETSQGVQPHAAATHATRKVGKTFAQTFSFLKNSDLFQLPPEPQIPEKIIPKNKNAIIVNSKQRGNPILKHVRNIPYEYGNIIPDYEIGLTSCVLFLSLRYHNLNPDYIHERLKQLGKRYSLRVLLVQVDIQNTKHSLKELGKMAILADCTLILAWSSEEAGRYLETYKSYEHKPPDVLQERVESDFIAKMQDVLTTIKSINKTDVITLLSSFGSFRNIVNASKEQIGLCPGFGPQKAQKLYKALNEPFRRSRVVNQLAEQGIETNPETSFTCKLKRPVGKKKDIETKLVKPVNEAESKTRNKQTLEVQKQQDSVDVPPNTKTTANMKSLSSSNMSKAEAIRQFGLSRQKGLKGSLSELSGEELSDIDINKEFKLEDKEIISDQSTNASDQSNLTTRSVNQPTMPGSSKIDVTESSKSLVTTSLKDDKKTKHLNTTHNSSDVNSTREQQHKTNLTEAEYNDLLASSDDESYHSDGL